VKDNKEPQVVLRLPPLEPATAAWLIALCGHLQNAIWQTYGDELEAYWTATQPQQQIYGPLQPARPQKPKKH
jgi:hypothetical protein